MCVCPIIKEDHPRVCGENLETASQKADKLGSPPRVRGKPEATRSDLAELGITPACAGKTASTNIRAVNKKDHPRVCGENLQHWTAYPH